MSKCASEFLVADSTSKKTPDFLALNADFGFLKLKAKYSPFNKCTLKNIGYCVPIRDESLGTLSTPLFLAGQ
jgi:hypothetical protein